MHHLGQVIFGDAVRVGDVLDGHQPLPIGGKVHQGTTGRILSVDGNTELTQDAGDLSGKLRVNVGLRYK
jgi:hypothetical protein